MATVTAKDGTTIAYERTGSGPAVILVDGALGYRASFGLVDVAKLLADHFTVYVYDRRGRGESSDALQASGSFLDRLPQAVEREVEDIAALIQEAGGQACLYGISSGAALVMEAAIRLGERVRRIAMYEPPFNDDPAARQGWQTYVRQLSELLAAGRNGDAVGLFMRLVGASEDDVAQVRQMPMWPAMEAVAPTLAYDHTALLGEEAALPLARAACVTIPALVINGSQSFPFMAVTAKALAEAMPNGQHRVLEGQTHEVEPQALAPVLVEFFQ